MRRRREESQRPLEARAEHYAARPLAGGRGEPVTEAAGARPGVRADAWDPGGRGAPCARPWATSTAREESCVAGVLGKKGLAGGRDS